MDTTVSADGTIIAYERAGRGPVVVLIGGAFSTRRDVITTELADALAGCFTVVSYDRRGRGDSGDTRPYAVEREIEDLDAVIASVGGPVMVFGRSSGAALALEAAADGLTISKIALYGPPYVADPRRTPRPSRRELAALVERERRGDAAALVGPGPVPEERLASVVPVLVLPVQEHGRIDPTVLTAALMPFLTG